MNSNASVPCAYEQHGQGPAVLCLAGFGCSNWIFDAIAQALGLRFTLVMPDHRGMGRSAPAKAPYSLQDLAGDALALMDKLGYHSFHVIGISMGTFVAQALCLAEPEHVKGLVLMCGTSAGPGFIPPPCLSENVLARAYQFPEQMVRQSLDMTTHPRFKRDNPTTYQELLRIKLQHLAKLDQLIWQSHAVARFLEGSYPLERLDMPTLVLSGDADRLVDPRNSQLLAQRIPNARLELFKETDHLFFLEEPAQVCLAIERFLVSL